jgi:hypothetical protein
VKSDFSEETAHDFDMVLAYLLFASALWLSICVNGQLTQISARDWASRGNPTNLDMFLHAPPTLPPNSPIVVAVSFEVS